MVVLKILLMKHDNMRLQGVANEKVLIVIVNFNGDLDTIECIKSIRQMEHSAYNQK